MRMFGHAFTSDTFGGGSFSPGEIFGGPFTKISQIRKSAEMAMIYDGLVGHDNWNTNRISARHARGKQTNFLFADGHAAPVDSKSLPNGNNFASSDLRSPQRLARCPFPKWRLDQ